MKTIQTTIVLFAAVLAGCRATDQAACTLPQPSSVETPQTPLAAVATEPLFLTRLPKTGEPSGSHPTVQQVAFDEPTEALPPPEPLEHAGPPPVLQSQELTLADLEQMALANNPVIGQALAQVNALQGNWVQVGLPPNPTLGYFGEEIGDDGTAGKQGLFVSQQFITGHKLALNRDVASQEVFQAEQQLAAQRQRVLTDVRTRYYDALIAQRRLDLARQLVDISEQAVDASDQLLGIGEVPKAGLLQTQVESQNAHILLRRAQNGNVAAWRKLTAVLGRPDLPPQQLAGDLNGALADLDWNQQLQRLLSQSPEMAAAVAQLDRARAALNRACAEVKPNVTVQGSVQYDYATTDTIAGLQVGVPLPIWNRNQGGIRQAQGEVFAAQQNIHRLELELQERLAEKFQQFADARFQVESYSEQILPKAQETYDLVQEGYSLGEAGYIDMLTAQRTYFHTNLAYLDALSEMWSTSREIEGLLLQGSLEQGSRGQ